RATGANIQTRAPVAERDRDRARLSFQSGTGVAAADGADRGKCASSVALASGLELAIALVRMRPTKTIRLLTLAALAALPACATVGVTVAPRHAAVLLLDDGRMRG